MDFYNICVREIESGPKKGTMECYPDFIVGKSQDLMVRGRSFYAIWDEAAGLWSTDEYQVQKLVDEDLQKYADKYLESTGTPLTVRYLRSYNSGIWDKFRKFMGNISDNSTQLDMSLTFANTEVKKTDYVSRRLPYALTAGPHDAWDELVGTLYAVDERAKIEWMIGAIVSGDSKKIQKFAVFYGPPGSGKGTVIDAVMKLFSGYTTTFDAKALGSSSASFALEVFKNNPLVGIQHDGDLSKIDDNARLNSIVSHEPMTINEKYKPGHTDVIHAFLVMGTNQPVKISDAKSGILRRLIDIHPSGVNIPINHYNTLISQVDFELGAIAQHCLEVYRDMGKNYFRGYRPLEMMLQTDFFFNFIEASYDVFKYQDNTTLAQAYSMYKDFCTESGIDKPLPRHKFREELRNYFNDFKDRGIVDGAQVRSFYSGFNANKFKSQVKNEMAFSLVLEETVSLLDERYASQPAQLGSKMETPLRPWGKLTSKDTLAGIDTSLLHFVKIPTQDIIIDFDLKGIEGEKSLERNLQAASLWPATYAELSKSGAGVHLHYEYDGDVSELNSVYSDGIEIKTLLGGASLRRRLTKCNNVPVATINGGLPLKEKKVLTEQKIKSEVGLRKFVEDCLAKKHHGHTKSEVDFIKHGLDQAFDSGMQYDLNDLRPRVIAFANNSSNQAAESLKVCMAMRWKSDDMLGEDPGDAGVVDKRVSFFDVEVYPNLFVVVVQKDGSDEFTILVNPSAHEVQALFQLMLVGYNCRRYDNHIMYAAAQGYNNLALYNLSQAIIDNKPNSLFGSAYNISYTDIYDFAAIKQSLKLWQVELGLNHREMDIPWSEPVPPELWQKVIDYCCNDVLSTKAVFHHLKNDFKARQILAELSGLTVNDTSNKHSTAIIFGNDRSPQDKFNIPDLTKEFPGYVFDAGKSSYRGMDPSEGGFVYEEVGIHENVVLMDISSMHPTTIEVLNLFGDEYTRKFADIKDARLAIKNGDFDVAETMLSGRLKPYLGDHEGAEQLSEALKIVINSVYGLTSAKFDNPFKSFDNKDNVVAKRGALFMIDLLYYLQENGHQVVHIKTDSVKIAVPKGEDTTPVLELVANFGAKYGYNFEHEATIEKLGLFNKSTYVAKYAWHKKARKIGTWDAVGAQYQHPVVYKSIFGSGDPIEFEDLREVKSVLKGAIYLDFEHDKPEPIVDGMYFVGRFGSFVPVEEGCGGGRLYRVFDGKPYAVAGTKGHLWMESSVALSMGEEVTIDMSYYDKLVEAAIKQIEKYGDYSWFIQ